MNLKIEAGEKILNTLPGENLPCSASSRRISILFSFLVFMFLASGLAALIYEVVWFQLLELVIGSSAFSLALLLSVYMGGLFLGSLLVPSFCPHSLNPLRLYAFFEAGIGLMGFLIPLVVPSIMKIYINSLGYGLPLFLVRGLFSALLLLWPTGLMGGTLPVVSRLISATPRGLSFIGWLYGINTAGGVLGTLIAGFYLLRIHDLTVATEVAVCLNFLLFLMAFILSFFPSFRLNETGREERSKFLSRGKDSLPSPFLPPGLIYFIIALSGLTALGAEVVWTRLLSLSLGGTVYTFSLLLAAFLAGLALGSAASSRLVTFKPELGEKALGLVQLALIPAIIWAAFFITRIVPFWLPEETSGPLRVFFHDFLLCSLSLWPAAFFWGASFPLALASVVRGGAETGRLVGRIYAANTAGSIAGSLLFGLVFLPGLGSSGCHRLFLFFPALSSCLIFYKVMAKRCEAPAKMERGSGEKIFFWLNRFKGWRQQDIPMSAKFQTKRKKILAASGLIIIYVLMVYLAWEISPSTPWQLIAYGRKAAEKRDRGKPLVVAEGINSSVAVTDWNGTLVFHTGGRAEASNALSDLRMERMLAHLPALIHPEPRKILVIGCGAGITAGTFLLYPTVERVVICEIEPAVWKKVVPFFRRENNNLDLDPRVKLVIEDARHFLLTTGEKFDLISSDPVHPWLKGSALLYTREYYTMIKDRLNPGGLFTQWVPLYESDEATVKSMLATFFSVFPEGLIWSNDFLGLDYDFVLLGQRDNLVIDIEAVQARLESEAFRQVAASLREIYFRSGLELLATYAGRRLDLSSWLEKAEINLDRNLRLQYLAGWGLHSPYRISLLDLLWKNFQFPADLFRGSKESLHFLERIWRTASPPDHDEKSK